MKVFIKLRKNQKGSPTELTMEGDLRIRTFMREESLFRDLLFQG